MSKALKANFKKPLSHASYASHTSHFAISKAQSSLQMVWLNPARSSESKFQETIVPRVIRVTHVPLCYQQSAKLLADAWLNPARSSESKFQETIVPRVSRVPHVSLRHRQSAKHKASHCTAACKARSSVKWGCALRVVERRPLFCDSVVKDQIGSFLCHFPSAQAHLQSERSL